MNRIALNSKKFLASPACRLVSGLFLACLSVSCQEQNVERLAFPYGKKKFDTGFWQRTESRPDTLPAGTTVCPDTVFPDYSLLAYALDSAFQPRPEWEFTKPFLWLQSPAFPEDRDYWARKQEEVSRAYLAGIPAPFKMDSEAGTQERGGTSHKESESQRGTQGDADRTEPILGYREPDFRKESQGDAESLQRVAGSLQLHFPEGTRRQTYQTGSQKLQIFYQGELYRNGKNPLVLLPCPAVDRHEHEDTTASSTKNGHPQNASPMESLQIPALFFEKGGIFAVLGENTSIIVQDSSRFRAKADSLRRRIYTDTIRANIAWRRILYQRFLSDSIQIASLIESKVKEIPARIQSKDLIEAANYLISKMFSTPSKMALLALHPQNALAENMVFQRRDLFRTVVMEAAPEPALDELWKSLAESLASQSPEEKGPEKKKDFPFPAVLCQASPEYAALAAYIQEQAGRVCGPKPFLLTNGLTENAIWAFIFYQTGMTQSR